MNPTTPPNIPSKSRTRQERLESIRPFVKKFQYIQLLLPEPPALTSATSERPETGLEQGKTLLQEISHA